MRNKSSYLKILLTSLILFELISCDFENKKGIAQRMEQLGKEKELVVQLAELEIDPNQLNAYLELLEEGIRASVRTEPRVLSRYAMSDKEQPNKITVVEIYANQEAYSAHRICSEKLVVSSSNTFATMNSKRHRVDRLGTQH